MVNALLTLRLTSEAGRGELTVEADHPLVAALRCAVEEGKPPGRWAYVVVQTEADPAPLVIGTLVHTVGDRILFFPASPTEVTGGSRPGDARFGGTQLDHVTLDPPDAQGRYSSHMAVRGTPQHPSRGLRYRTRAPLGSMLPWFTLLHQSLDSFPLLPRLLLLHFPQIRPDLERFAEEVMHTRGMVATRVPEPNAEPSFCQIEFWVGRGTAWQALNSRLLAWAYIPEIVEDAPRPQQETTLTSVDIGLAPEVGVRIICGRPQGRLKSPRIVRPSLSEVDRQAEQG